MISSLTSVPTQNVFKTLTDTARILAETHNRVSSGYRISTAEDDAAHWSISTTLQSDVGALSAVTDARGLTAGVIGAIEARVDGNVALVKNLLDANNRGIGQLVDADLNEQSSKLKALQVQEQLAIQALSIANNSSQNILRLSQ